MGKRNDNRGRGRRSWVALCCVLLAGCATPQWDRLRQRPPDLPERATVAAVPFFAQEDYQCGPAALASVLDHAGLDLRPAELVPQVYLPLRKGSLQIELMAATRRHGLIAYEMAPQLTDLLRELAAGNPVLVLQDVGSTPLARWHYAVATGYDLPAARIFLYSGNRADYSMGLAAFERTWRPAAYWAMLAMPPPDLPASADELRYLRAAAALERTAPVAAGSAYRAALARWPESLGGWIGLGNVAYAAHDQAAAVAAYRQAVRSHAEAADAWNNYATALCEEGQGQEARLAIAEAIRIAGPGLENYRATSRNLAARCPAD